MDWLAPWENELRFVALWGVRGLALAFGFMFLMTIADEETWLEERVWKGVVCGVLVLAGLVLR